MAARLTFSRSTLCSSCMHRIAGDDIAQLWFPFYRQLRGKKKSAERPTTINVKLLEDIVGFGRKGSFCPVEPGRMRNSWYPRQKAAYVTESTLQGVKPQNLVAERDFGFGMNAQQEQSPKVNGPEKKGMVEVQTKLLPPQRASELIETTVPPSLIFYRTPINSLEPEVPIQERPNGIKRATSAAELAASAGPLPNSAQPQSVPIFGSVSTADMAESIKAVLARTSEGARVVIGAEDISIIQNKDDGYKHQDRGVEGDRLKALGDFQVEIRVKGGEPVIRTVSVKAQEVNST